MLRSFLGLSNKQVAAESASAKVLKEILPGCPTCGRPLVDHQYRLVATTPMQPDRLERFRELLAAVCSQEWQNVARLQTWVGDQVNAEVYGLRCPGQGLSVAIISAPFALGEPYTLLHLQIVDDPARFELYLPNNNVWHPL